MAKSNITSVTRRNIADQLTVGGYTYNGRLEEPEFLGRIFNLNELRSYDSRFPDMSGDIWQHRVNNPTDWSEDWVFTDSRLNLMHGPDETYLAFLSETIHPIVRRDHNEAQALLAIYNQALAADGYELIATGDISGHPVFQGVRRVAGAGHLQEQKKAIKQYLNTDYIQQRLAVMHNAIHTQTDLAIGLAKELLETTCKSILRQQNKPIDKDWTVSRLLKETTASLDFTPKEAAEPQKADTSVRQVLSGLSTTVQGITELRNSYGSGHGKAADFKGLEPKYANFIVSIVGEICVLLLATAHDAIELVEPQQPEQSVVAPAAASIEDDLPF